MEPPIQGVYLTGKTPGQKPHPSVLPGKRAAPAAHPPGSGSPDPATTITQPVEVRTSGARIYDAF